MPRVVIPIRPPAPPGPPAPEDGPSIRESYAEEGVDGFYARTGATYRNPHAAEVQAAIRLALAWGVPAAPALDLGCGSGEVWEALAAAGATPDQIDACDPWTGPAFRARTGRDAHPWGFTDILGGVLGTRRYATIFASYTLHLCPEGMIPPLLDTLARHADHLLILSPHKRPRLDDPRAWTLRRADYTPGRVRVRWYTGGRAG